MFKVNNASSKMQGDNKIFLICGNYKLTHRSETKMSYKNRKAKLDTELKISISITYILCVLCKYAQNHMFKHNCGFRK